MSLPASCLSHRLTLSVQQTDVSVELCFCHIMTSDECLSSDAHVQSTNSLDIGMGSVVVEVLILVNSRALTAMLYAICLLGPSCN